MINTQNKEENPLLLQLQSHFAPQNKEDFMLDKMIGFIGAGNMGSAMIGGILDASLVTTSQIIASAHSPETLDKIRTKFSIETTQSNEVVAERSDILFLAVKPNKFSEDQRSFKTGLYRSFDCSRTADRKYRGAAR